MKREGKCKDQIGMNLPKNSFFGGGYAFVCMVVSTITTCRVYPFIGLADGFSRWKLALEIYNQGHIASDTLLSPIIPYIQALTYKLTNSYGFYTWLQCVAFYLSVGMLAATLLPTQRVRIGKQGLPVWFCISVMTLCIPTVRIFPAMLTDSAPVFVLLVIFIKFITAEKFSYKIFAIGIITVFLTVSIRINSVVLFIGIFALNFIRYFHKKEKRVILSQICICAGVILGIMLPSTLLPTSYNASTLGMVWEMTGMVKEYELEDLAEELSDYGDIDEAVERYGSPYLNAIVWDNSPPFPAKDIAGEYSNEIIKLYIRTVINHPVKYIEMKWDFACSSLGIGSQLITSGRGVHYVDDVTLTYGAVSTDAQTNDRELFITFTDSIGIVSLRPIVMIALSILLIVLLKFSTKSTIFSYVFLVAVLYYSSFLINTQAFEFRYYAPTFFLLLVVVLCAVARIIDTIFARFFERKALENDAKIAGNDG